MISSIQSVAGQPVAAPDLDADAPGCIAIGLDLVAQRQHLIPGRRDGVPSGIEVVLRIPYQALAVEAVPHASRHRLAIRTLDIAMSSQRLVVLLLQPVL